MKKIIFPLVAVVFAGFIAVSPVQAATPTFSLTSAGGDSFQMSVSGDSNATVMFYYNVGSSSGMQVRTLGTTNSSGSFSTTISTSGYGINSGNSTYIIVNGQQSPMQAWPSTTTSGTLSLSQTSVTIGLGQSLTVIAQGSTNPVYMSTNANPSVAAVQTNGTQQITVTGNQLGSTVASICYVGSASNCVNLNVNVQSASVQTLSLSQNNLTLATGQNIVVTINGGTGNYNITSNSNTAVVSTSLSGNAVTLYGAASGSATVTICDSSNSCATLYASVNSSTSNGSLSFSPMNPSLSIGQAVVVNIFGGSGYYITNNSNNGAVSVALNGSALTISGLANGSATITVCSAANGCGSLYGSVGSSSTGQSVSFGVTNPTVGVGQTATISLSGALSYSISSNSNSAIVQASLNGNALVLSGLAPGSASLVVCASTGGCNTLYVTVASSTTGGTTTPNTALLAQVQSMQTQLTQLVSVIQTMQAQLTQMLTGLGNTTTVTVPPTSTSSSAASGYKFENFIGLGSTGTDVTQLQQRLTSGGFYAGPITGYYGSLTETAVEAYQTAHGIAPLGYVGPSTRAALNGG